MKVTITDALCAALGVVAVVALYSGDSTAPPSASAEIENQPGYNLLSISVPPATSVPNYGAIPSIKPDVEHLPATLDLETAHSDWESARTTRSSIELEIDSLERRFDELERYYSEQEGLNDDAQVLEEQRMFELNQLIAELDQLEAQLLEAEEREFEAADILAQYETTASNRRFTRF